MSVYHLCAWCPQRLGEGARASRTGVIDNCEFPNGRWKPHLPESTERTTSVSKTEPPLQEQYINLKHCFRKTSPLSSFRSEDFCSFVFDSKNKFDNNKLLILLNKIGTTQRAISATSLYSVTLITYIQPFAWMNDPTL